MSKKNTSAPDAEALLQLLARANRPLHLDDILRHCGAPRRAKKEIQEILQDLAAQGKIMRLSGGAYMPSSMAATVVGRFFVQRSGAAFVTPEAKASGDVYIRPGLAGEAWHGDLVRVALAPAKRGRAPEGRVAEVLERRVKHLAAYVQARHGKELICVPADPRYSFTLKVDLSAAGFNEEGAPRRGALVLLQPSRALGENLWQAVLLRDIGSENSVAAQEMLVKIAHQAPGAFPPAALAEAAALPENPTPEDWKDREDLRAAPFVTIDGADARDFDDAVFVRREGKGFVLHVAIADVSRYAPPGSALDDEALLRGNSWYFPSSVEPMLPEALSNGLCSLRPHVPRLAMAVEIHYDESARPLRSRFFPTVISSAARLTYSRVGAFLQEHGAGGPPAAAPKGARGQGQNPAGPQNRAQSQSPAAPPAPEEDFSPQVAEMLRAAAALSDLLGERRRKAGALDFDLPEAEYEIGENGALLAVKTRERNKAHLLIENFMIAANEAAAVFLKERGVPFLYRIHPEPGVEQMAEFFRALDHSGLMERSGLGAGSAPAEGAPPRKPGAGDKSRAAASGPKTRSAASLPEILRAFKGTPGEFPVGRMALRSMPKAMYYPFNSGHFGLGLEDYCHFTSPIRRYADLVVHRALKLALGLEKSAPPPAKKLLAIAERINECEISAAEAEREMLRRMGVLALYDRVGEEFAGTVSGVNDFGIFVLLDAMPVEGMARVESLGDDFYEYDPETRELTGVGTGRRFGLGMRVETRLAGVDRGRLEINLELLGGGGQGRRRLRPAGNFGAGGKKNGARRGPGDSRGKGGKHAAGAGAGRGAGGGRRAGSGRGRKGA